MVSLYKFLIKYGTVFALGLGGLIIIWFLVSVNLGLSGMGFDVGTDLVEKSKTTDISFFNSTMYITFFLIILAVVIWLFFGAVGLITNLKGSYKFLITVGVLVLLYIIFYSTSSVDHSSKLYEYVSKPEFYVTESVLKNLSAAIKTTFALFIISIVTLVVSEILGFFK
ncbi:MAG: hypothetical protein R2771_16335 [Saprospiraceae bacterium]